MGSITSNRNHLPPPEEPDKFTEFDLLLGKGFRLPSQQHEKYATAKKYRHEYQGGFKPKKTKGNNDI